MTSSLIIASLLTTLCLTPFSSYAASVHTVVATLNVGVTPGGIAITPNNQFAYVANSNNYQLTDGDSVSVLDLTNNTLKKTIYHNSFDEPYTVTINPSGTKAYVTNSGTTTITVIDTHTNTVSGIIDGFNGPSGMVISPSGMFGYVNNYGFGNNSGSVRTVSVVDLLIDTVVNTIVVGLAPAAMAISPDGNFLYVINYVDGNPENGTMSIVDTRNNTIVTTIAGFSGPFKIAVTPDGDYAYVTNFGSNNFIPIGTSVSVVDLTTHAITKTINLAIQPSGIAISPDGLYAYVTNYNTLYADNRDYTRITPGQGTVNIIDIDTNTVIPPTIAVGQSPSTIEISPDGAYAYVTNHTSNTVSVIELEPTTLKG